MQVVDMEEVVELTYTGDTTFKALLPPSAQAEEEEDSRVPRPLSARVVVVECTYLEAEDREAADKYQHVHLEVGKTEMTWPYCGCAEGGRCWEGRRSWSGSEA